LGLDLADDFGDITGARLCLRRSAFRRDEAETIGRAEIAEGIVRRDNLPPPGRNFSDFRRDLFFECVELAEIDIRIGAIGRGALGVGGD
jgi:hypothetical protein